MLRDNLVELIEPMLNSAGADPLALYIHTRTPATDDRLPCHKNPRPEGAESSLTESASSPFQAEPAHGRLFIGYHDCPPPICSKGTSPSKRKGASRPEVVCNQCVAASELRSESLGLHHYEICVVD